MGKNRRDTNWAKKKKKKEQNKVSVRESENWKIESMKMKKTKAK